MKVLGIGNAIVDVICKIEDRFLIDNKLTKSTMKLVAEDEFKTLLRSLKIEKTISGGSVANSIVGISQLGNQVGFIGKVNDDDLGNRYLEGMEKEKVKFKNKIKSEKISTGTCLILITPDSERTMCTFLGVAGKINENDVDETVVRKSDITFLEGYLWDKGEPQKAFSKAISNSNLSAMTLSDIFCVKRHKDNFLNLVKNKLDIIFANEQEMAELIGARNFNDIIEFGKKLEKLFVITRGDKGAIAIKSNNVEECEAEKNLNLKDLTGAGDLFAAGFLHCYVNNKTLKESLSKGTELSSKIIQKIGARL